MLYYPSTSLFVLTLCWYTDHDFVNFRKLSSIYVFSYFPFGFEGRIWDLIVSVPDHCLSFNFGTQTGFSTHVDRKYLVSCCSSTELARRSSCSNALTMSPREETEAPVEI